MKRKKMKVNILSLLGLAAMLFTACATDDVAPDRQNQKQKSDGEGLTAFSVNNETPPHESHDAHCRRIYRHGRQILLD